MNWTLEVKELLEWLDNPETSGEYDGVITGIEDLRLAKTGHLSFMGGGKFARYLETSQASVVLIPKDHSGQPPTGRLWVKLDDPSIALARICARLEERIVSTPEPGIHPTAIIDPSAQIDPSATVGPYCVVGPDVVVKSGAVLESHVRLDRGVSIGFETYLHHSVYIGWGCQIGNGCHLFSGVSIGADGFGFHSDKTGHHRLPQIGIVIVEDNVEIGANTAIDRARFAATRIGEGTKIDNLVQIGHNVIIGKHCILCAEVGIAGSAELGNFVVLAGQVGVAGHLKVGDGVTATGQTGISKDIPAGTVLSGTPASIHRDEMKRIALLRKLPEMEKRLRQLEQKRENP